jgi:predicted permease
MQPLFDLVDQTIHDPKLHVIFVAVLSVFGVMAAGGVVRRLNWLTEEADQSLMRLVIRLLLPCLIFTSVVGNEQLFAARNLLIPPLVGFGTLGLGIAVGALVSRLLPARITGLPDSPARRTFDFSVGSYNYSYIPIPLIALLYKDRPQEASNLMGVLFVNNLGVEIGFWTMGVLVLTGGLTPGWYLKIINAPLITIVIASSINFLGWHDNVPQFVMSMAKMLGQASIPLAVILVGAIAADHFDLSLRTLQLRVMAWSCALRLLVLPILFLLLAWGLPQLMTIPPDLLRVIVIQGAMPAAMFPIVMAKHYQGSPAVAVRVAIATTIVCLLTTPLWLRLGFNLLGSQ